MISSTQNVSEFLALNQYIGKTREPRQKKKKKKKIDILTSKSTLVDLPYDHLFWNLVI